VLFVRSYQPLRFYTVRFESSIQSDTVPNHAQARCLRSTQSGGLLSLRLRFGLLALLIASLADLHVSCKGQK